MRIVIAPDKFKGSLTSAEVCRHIASGLLEGSPGVEVFLMPMADGGEGFAEILKNHLKTATIPCLTVDPLGRSLEASYEWDAVQQTAIIELAASSGMALLSPGERDPLKTSTFGTGLIIKQAVAQGAEHILLGLGGSATNDGGIGILAALGIEFNGSDGMPLSPVGENLSRIVSIHAPSALASIRLTIACDVGNPLFGENGAAKVYAPQKGASEAAVQELDRGLRHLNQLLIERTGNDHSELPGSGAAGGIAAGLMAFFPVTLQAGVNIVSQAAGLSDGIAAADLVITGEGQLDGQSLEGKVVSHVTGLARRHGKPVIIFAGRVTLDEEELRQLAFNQVIALADHSPSLEYSTKYAPKLLHHQAAGAIKAFRLT